jgi:hypothetical protein
MAQNDTTGREDREFKEDLEKIIQLPGDILTTCIDLISDSLDPGQVFEDYQLLEYVHGKFEPEDVFNYMELSQWAEENGFSKDG